MIKNLRHVGLVVSDMARAIRWYRKLGCRVIRNSTEEWGGKKLQVYKMTNNIELIKGMWVKHAAFTVDSMEDCRIWDTYARKDGVIFVRDPDGNVIELVKEEK